MTNGESTAGRKKETEKKNLRGGDVARERGSSQKEGKEKKKRKRKTSASEKREATDPLSLHPPWTSGGPAGPRLSLQRTARTKNRWSRPFPASRMEQGDEQSLQSMEKKKTKKKLMNRERERAKRERQRKKNSRSKNDVTKRCHSSRFLLFFPFLSSPLSKTVSFLIS